MVRQLDDDGEGRNVHGARQGEAASHRQSASHSCILIGTLCPEIVLETMQLIFVVIVSSGADGRALA